MADGSGTRNSMRLALGLSPEIGMRQQAERLRAETILECGLTAVEALRIEAGFPHFGADITDKNLPRMTGLEFLKEARAYHRSRPANFCANEVWYGYFHRVGLKKRLCQLVGWERADRDPVLGTSAAYDVAYEVIYQALPDCRGRCACTAIWEALLSG